MIRNIVSVGGRDGNENFEHVSCSYTYGFPTSCSF